MKVYYESSLWYRRDKQGEKEQEGLKQKVNWQFEYLGQKHIIPYIYQFNKGIVVDIIAFLDEAKVEAFFKKYEHINEDELTNAERIHIEEECPNSKVDLNQIWLNGKRVNHGYSSSSASLLPNRENKEVLEIKEIYKDILEGYSYFSCQRVRIPYPTPNRGYKRIKAFRRGKPIDSLRFTTRKQYKTYSIDKSFTLNKEQPEYELSFEHPVSTKVHTIVFKWEEQVEIPLKHVASGKIYSETASYKVTPEIEVKESLIFDTSMQYRQKEKNSGGYFPQAVGSIGIIGGSCGPTALFVTGKKGKETDEKLVRYCFSKPSMDRETTQFYLESIRVQTVDCKIYEFKQD
ncbi:MAG: hypothetical protein E7231_16135 [Cellulosilyticum sp.]|nr:hypothetical protein [Cellulosilyticum sp.]